jgi:hypothetical protein
VKRLKGTLILLVSLLFCGSVAFAQVEWLPLRIDNEKKPIAFFPGQIEEISDTVPTALGEMPFTTYFTKDDDALTGNRLYMMTVIDYARGAFPADSIERRNAFFEQTVSAAHESIGGEVVISQPTKSGTHEGWIFRINYGEERPTVVRNRMYIVGDRYYHQQVFSFMKDGGVKSRERFFDNFNPIEPAPPKSLSKKS